MAIIEEIKGTALSGKFYRIIPQRWADDSLGIIGSLKNGARYNIKNIFGGLYLGYNIQTCIDEKRNRGILADIPPDTDNHVIWEYQTELHSVVRLDLSKTRKMLNLKLADIVRNTNNPLIDYQKTQALGLACFNSNKEGIVYPSARRRKKDGRCLFAIPDNISLPSKIVPVRKAKFIAEYWLNYPKPEDIWE